MLKIFKQKKFFPWLTVIFISGLFFLSAAPARADIITDTALTVFGTIIGLIVSVLGQLLLLVISVLVTVAQFNNFIASPPVQQGWSIVRDICNMFFVLVLLLVAFATILRVENYSIKQLFKRVIIFAILINFSKLFCGLIIDFAQVVMLTFVNAFKDIGGGNFSTLLGVDQLLAINENDFKNGADFWSIIGSYVLALIYVVIMLVVMVALLATLVYRIVMLWIYIILSPLAYLANIAPLMQGVSKQWWSQFFQQVATGPLLAFFIWLSLATLGQFSGSNQEWAQEMRFGSPNAPKNVNLTAPTAGITQVGTVDHMLRFVVSLGLLIGGLVVSKSFGGSAGAAISKVVGGAQKGAGWMKRNVAKVAKPAAKYAAQKTWQGSKALGRGGLALAKTVDYGVSMRGRQGAHWLRNRFRDEEDRTAFQYKYDQGLLSRAGAGVRQNVFTKQGWRDNFNAASRALGMETNRRINQQRAAATASGFHKDEKGVEYFHNKEKGTFETKNGQTWNGPNGKAIKAYSSFGEKFYANLHATKATTALDKAFVENEKKELEDLAAPYADFSRDQLHALTKGTADPKKLAGMFMALVGKDGEKGGLKDEAMFRRAQELFANSPEKLKILQENVAKKQADLVYDMHDMDEYKAFKKLVAKRKINLEDQNLAALDFDDPDQKTANNNKEKLANLVGAFRDALHKERWSNSINKIDKDGDPGVAKKVAEALGILSDRAENNRDQVLGRAAANMEKLDNKIKDNKHKVQDNDNRVALKEQELVNADADAKKEYTPEKAQRIADIIKEKEALQKEGGVLRKEGSALLKNRELLDKKQDKDRQLADKYNRDAYALRSDRLTLDLDGDFIKSFSTRDIKDEDGNVIKKGSFDRAMASEFFATASAKQLAQINMDSLRKDPESIQLAADKITFEKLKNLERSGNNPELARQIAQEKLKQGDPESAKIVNLYNDMDFNMNESQFNGAIRDVLKSRRDSKTDLGRLNNIRQYVAKKSNNASYNMDNKEDVQRYKQSVDGFLDDFSKIEQAQQEEEARKQRQEERKIKERSGRIADHYRRLMSEGREQPGSQATDAGSAATSESVGSQTESQSSKSATSQPPASKPATSQPPASKPATSQPSKTRPRPNRAAPDNSKVVNVDESIDQVIANENIVNEAEKRPFNETEMKYLKRFVAKNNPATKEDVRNLIDEYNVYLRNQKKT